MASTGNRRYSAADEDEDGLSVYCFCIPGRPTLEYNKDRIGSCVGLFIEMHITIGSGDEVDIHRSSFTLPCPNCSQQPGITVADELFFFLCDELDRYDLPEYWILSVRNTLFDLFVTPAASSRNCSLLPSNRSAPYVDVFIDGDPEYIDRMPDFLPGQRLPSSTTHQPAEEAAVRALQPPPVDVEGGCPICLDGTTCIARTEQPQSFLRMPCTHVFHRECLLMWLNRHHTCPYCRYELPVQTAT